MARVVTALSQLPFGVARELDANDLLRKPITIIGDDPRVDVLTVAWTITFARAGRIVACGESKAFACPISHWRICGRPSAPDAQPIRPTWSGFRASRSEGPRCGVLKQRCSSRSRF